MKEITIFSTQPITITDKSNEPIEKYASKLSNLLENNNVTILHTTSCSLILRPSLVDSILVSETGTKEKKKITKKSEKKENEDIITD